jgi:SAM-dependent methyltransferase
MTNDEAQAILRKTKYWHYPFTLPWGQITPSRATAERHFLRRQHFFEPLLGLYGGSLRNKRVLDLGCCQGFWSFEASKSGAASCVGIDSSRTFIREAKALCSLYGFEQCEFRCAHLEEDLWWQDLNPSQITLFLGLFYHLADPLYVFRKASEFTTETIVIDTVVTKDKHSTLEIVRRDLQEFTTRESNISTGLRIVPSPAALYDLVRDVGFETIHALKPAKGLPQEYLKGQRISIIAQRQA